MVRDSLLLATTNLLFSMWRFDLTCDSGPMRLWFSERSPRGALEFSLVARKFLAKFRIPVGIYQQEITTFGDQLVVVDFSDVK